jgi:hypothetical protein
LLVLELLLKRSTVGGDQLTDELESIRRRLQSIEKELNAIKQGAWAGVVRYQQIMDDEVFEGTESEVFTDSDDSLS